MDAQNGNQHLKRLDDGPRASATDTTKRAYSKPTLTEFGDVVDLTRGSAGSGFDGPITTRP